MTMHLCPECQQITLPAHMIRCSFCDEGEGTVQNGAASATSPTLKGKLAMCKDGLLIVMAELYETEKVDAPQAAIQMVDVIGPLMMDTMRSAKGWTHAQMAHAVIKQKAAMYSAAGVPAPDKHPLEEIINLLSELQGEKKAKAE